MVIIPISLLAEEEKGLEVLVEEILEVEVITMVKCAHVVELIGTPVEECYRKHGYPPGHKLYRTQNGSINNAMREESNASDLNDSQETQNQNIRVMPQQYQVLMSLLQHQSNNGGFTSGTSHINQVGTVTKPHIGKVLSFTCSISKAEPRDWILDSGATNHVACSLKFFYTHKQISPITVQLPTGQQVIVTHSGIVKFFDSLYLENVLYLPIFNFNLISISKLVANLRCQLIFSSDHCLILDVTNQRMIGTIECVQGLYRLMLPSAESVVINTISLNAKSVFSCNKVPINLCHFCLGHPSHDRFHLLK
ncbi:uncharacterized protein [Glycine max]|uniref:uncharacterized protein n=1 Tax=Glycine max TaxID=3847 RepID=UPI0003DE76A6|nr:uncharacterized protein LOC102659499 [Glycine max]|eukprot:XP_006594179.1 uncharacterized protein LOC102659499 [Glycine max]